MLRMPPVAGPTPARRWPNAGPSPAQRRLNPATPAASPGRSGPYCPRARPGRIRAWMASAVSRTLTFDLTRPARGPRSAGVTNRARHPSRCPIVLLVITDQDAGARRATQTLDQPFDAGLAAIQPPRPGQSVLAVAPPGTGAGNWVGAPSAIRRGREIFLA